MTFIISAVLYATFPTGADTAGDTMAAYHGIAAGQHISAALADAHTSACETAMVAEHITVAAGHTVETVAEHIMAAREAAAREAVQGLTTAAEEVH